MTRSADATGFNRETAPVASPRLLRAVAASLMLAACFCVAVTALSIKVAMAMPALS